MLRVNLDNPIASLRNGVDDPRASFEPLTSEKRLPRVAVFETPISIDRIESITSDLERSLRAELFPKVSGLLRALDSEGGLTRPGNTARSGELLTKIEEFLGSEDRLFQSIQHKIDLTSGALNACRQMEQLALEALRLENRRDPAVIISELSSTSKELHARLAALNFKDAPIHVNDLLPTNPGESVFRDASQIASRVQLLKASIEKSQENFQELFDARVKVVATFVHIVFAVDKAADQLDTLLQRWKADRPILSNPWSGPEMVLAKALKEEAVKNSADGSFERTLVLYERAAVLVQRALIHEKAIKEVLKHMRGGLSVVVQDGDEFVQNGEVERALVHYKAAIRSSPASDSSYYRLAQAYKMLQRNDEAKETAWAGLEMQPESTVCFEILRGYSSRKDQEFLPRLNALVQSHKRSILPQIELSRIYLERRMFDQAFNTLNAVIGMEPRNDQARSVLGLALERKGMFDEARDQYEVALEVRPGNVEALLGLARMSERHPTRDGQAALAYVTKAIASDPEQPASFMALKGLVGKTPALQELPQLVLELHRIALSHPTSAQAHFALGQANLELYRKTGKSNRLEKAILSLNRASKINPYRGDVLVALGEVHEAAGDLSQAFRAYQRALTLNQSDKNLAVKVSALASKVSGSFASTSAAGAAGITKSAKLNADMPLLVEPRFTGIEWDRLRLAVTASSQGGESLTRMVHSVLRSEDSTFNNLSSVADEVRTDIFPSVAKQIELASKIEQVVSTEKPPGPTTLRTRIASLLTLDEEPSLLDGTVFQNTRTLIEDGIPSLLFHPLCLEERVKSLSSKNLTKFITETAAFVQQLRERTETSFRALEYAIKEPGELDATKKAQLVELMRTIQRELQQDLLQRFDLILKQPELYAKAVEDGIMQRRLV